MLSSLESILEVLLGYLSSSLPYELYPVLKIQRIFNMPKIEDF